MVASPFEIGDSIPLIFPFYRKNPPVRGEFLNHSWILDGTNPALAGSI